MGFEDFVRLGNFQTMQPQLLHRAAGAEGSSWKATVKDVLGGRWDTWDIHGLVGFDGDVYRDVTGN